MLSGVGSACVDICPILASVEKSFKSHIGDFMVVRGSKVLEQGLNKNSIFGSNSFKGDVLAVKMVF